MQNFSILALTLVATAVVADARFVGFDGAQVDVAGDKPLGVSKYAAAVGDAYAADVLGTTKVEAGAPIPILAKGLTPVKSDALGRAIPHGGVGEIAGYLVGNPALAVGQIVEILLKI